VTWRLRLVLIVLAGLALRVGYVFAYRRHITPTGDAFYFHYQADLLAQGKGFIDPYSLFWAAKVVPGATHPPLWTLVLALAAALGSTTFFAQLLWSCAIGATSVAAVALAGREVAGARAGLIAAGITALYPVFLIDDGSLLAETIVVPLVALVVWAFYRLWHRPSLPRAALLGALCALCALTRSELVLLVLLLAVPAGMLCRARSWRRRLAMSGIAVVAAACTFVPWWAYTLPRYTHPELLSNQLGVTLASANCNQTYGGRLFGYWDDACEVAILTPKAKDASERDEILRQTAIRYVEHHASRVPAVVAARLGRALGVYRPGQEISLEWLVLGRPEVPAWIGLGVFYPVALLGVAGVVVLRGRRLPLWPFGVILGEVVLVSAAVFGQTRYRTPLDTVLVMLAAVAVDRFLDLRSQHWRGARLSGSQRRQVRGEAGSERDARPTPDAPAITTRDL
jgi:4-amino-4-deoxy-L-arabinose transferase-like glycosyltransferase